jgi:hypothetical protein
MNRSFRRSGVAWSIVACLVVGGCGVDDETDPPADGTAAGAAAAGGAAGADEDAAGFAPAPDRETLPHGRIYFTLTQHEWYARGQPLLHDNVAYRPMGMPIPASVPEMRSAGEYQGVEYYVREADTERAVYVPVFEGYWQPFRADSAAAAAN